MGTRRMPTPRVQYTGPLPELVNALSKALSGQHACDSVRPKYNYAPADSRYVEGPVMCKEGARLLDKVVKAAQKYGTDSKQYRSAAAIFADHFEGEKTLSFLTNERSNDE